MKAIINNEDKLNINDIDMTTNKVRAIILDDKNKIIIVKYADIFMLPGGKVDKNESSITALIRELKEELGMNFQTDEIIPFLQIESYEKNYPLVESNKLVNRLNKTDYYIIRTNKMIRTNDRKLTNREKNNNFKIMYYNLDEACNIISNYNSTNIRNTYYKTELIKVFKELNNSDYYTNYTINLEREQYKDSDNALDLFHKNFYLYKIINPYQESEKILDLHIHTSYSDGELYPDLLINQAIEKRISTLAITDHDTIDGIKNIKRYGPLIEDTGIQIINGIELSAKVDKGRMHILGYDFDINSKPLNDKMIEYKNNNINYILSILEQIKINYNIRFTYEELKNLINSNHNLGRPDIAKLLIKNGYANTVKEAFDKYLIDANNKLGNRKKGFEYSECIDLIIKSNGIPVLAHPKTLELNDKELLYLLKDMISCGLMGIEAYHSTHTKEETEKYLKIANELGLLVSGGSDYHGMNTKPEVKLGTGINNNLKIKKLSLLDYINNKKR